MSRQHTYQKNPFKTTTGDFVSGHSSYNARSGLHSFPSVKYGEIPNGNYTVSSTSNTGDVQRFNLAPSQDIGPRSNLQIHPKSTNSFKNTLGIDTKGCIAVDQDAMKNVRVGDKLRVETRKPTFSNQSDVMASIVQHNSVFETVDYDPHDYFDDAPGSSSSGLCIIY